MRSTPFPVATRPAPVLRPGGHARVGRALAWIAGGGVFLLVWYACASALGGWGLALGWIPAGMAASLAALIGRFLWIPVLALALVVLAVTGGRHSASAPPPLSPPAAAQPTTIPGDGPALAPPAADAPVAAYPPSPARAPDPPDLAAAEAGAADFARAFAAGGVAGAARAVMACDQALAAAPAWSRWDRCAVLDAVAARHLAEPWPAGGGFFDPARVEARRARTAAPLDGAEADVSDRLALVPALAAQAEAAWQAREAERSARLLAGACPPDAGAVRRFVCATPLLAEADRGLAEAYGAALARASDPAAVQAAQERWVRVRDAGPADVGRLTRLYAARRRDLEESVGGHVSAATAEDRTLPERRR